SRALPQTSLRRYSQELRPKLAHIAVKAGQSFNTRPARLRQFLALLLHGHDGPLWSTRCQFVERGVDHIEAISGLSEQNHHAQTAHLLLIIEPIVATPLAHRLQKTLLFPEM